MKNETILKVANLTKSFSKKVKAVDDVSFEVEKGDIYGFLGVNGAGKSTTIRMICTLLRPDRGAVHIGGHCIKAEKNRALAKIGAMIEGPAFYPYLSAKDNLKIFAGYHKDIPEKRIDELIELVGLKGRERDKAGTYSMGMKQRLGIAQSLLNSPELLILDEPTNGLDPYGIREMRELILRLKEQDRMTILISSHILYEIQLICNRVAIIDKGRIMVKDRVDRLLNGDNRIYSLEGPRKERLIEQLQAQPGLKVVSEEPLRIELEQIEPEELLKRLIMSGSAISSFSPYKPKLEDFFFNLTAEEGSAK